MVLHMLRWVWLFGRFGFGLSSISVGLVGGFW